MCAALSCIYRTRVEDTEGPRPPAPLRENDYVHSAPLNLQGKKSYDKLGCRFEVCLDCCICMLRIYV